MAKDFLSLVSDDLLLQILCLTKSYKDAVVCSSLSKRFRNLYKNLPCLYLDNLDFYAHISEDEDENSIVMNRSSSTIHGHLGNLHIFFLDVYHEYYHIWEWFFDYLLHLHKIEHLCMILWHCDGPAEFPMCIFDCPSLVTLRLQIFRIEAIPNTFQGFPNLCDCNLCLDFIEEADVETFNTLFSRCPALQNLKLQLNLLDMECRVPIIFSSTSLLNLDVELIQASGSRADPEPESSLKIKIQTPLLLMLKLESDNYDDYKVEVYLDAPKLLELSVPSQYIAMHINNFPKAFQGSLNAKWTGDHHHHHLTSLQFINKPHPQMPYNLQMHHLNDIAMQLNDIDDTAILHVISKFNSLTVLELSMIHAHPMEFHRMLTCLLLLEKLMFTDCYFQEKHDQKTFDRKDYKMARLAEIGFTNRGFSCLEGERKMLYILLQMTPNLTILRFVLKQEKLGCKDEYAAVLGQLLSHGDCLNLKESSE